MAVSHCNDDAMGQIARTVVYTGRRFDARITRHWLSPSRRPPRQLENLTCHDEPRWDGARRLGRSEG